MMDNSSVGDKIIQRFLAEKMEIIVLNFNPESQSCNRTCGTSSPRHTHCPHAVMVQMTGTVQGGNSKRV